MIFRAQSIRVALVIPVYDDGPSLNRLLNAIDEQPGLERVKFDVFVVNDGSQVTPSIEFYGENQFRRIHSISLVNLICNLGHQRAITVGLVMASKQAGEDGVLVMDSDGEDRPEDIQRLIATTITHPKHIVCARRTKRSESFGFKSFYLLYKIVFRMLAGTTIDFGNFCYIPRTELHRLLHSPSLWNHLAATLARSRVPLMRIPAERGCRYAGRSKMNLDALIAHGLSAISVYADIVLVRIMIGMLGIAALTVVGLFGITAMRLFTDLAIPGWASTIFSSLSIVLFQSLIFAVISAFLLLNARSAKPVIPMIDAPQFVASLKRHDMAGFKNAKAS
jgi:glycosyltransferase involved in cell wall biosynthesis